MLSSHYLITAISAVCLLGSSMPVYSKPENEILLPIVRLLGKWQKPDCGKVRIQLPMLGSLESLKRKNWPGEQFDFMLL